MNVQITFSSQLARKAGVAEQTLDLPDGTTVQDAIRHVANAHGEEFASLVGGTDSSQMRTTLLAAVNGEQVHDLAGRVLHEGNELMLLMPMAGG